MMYNAVSAVIHRDEVDLLSDRQLRSHEHFSFTQVFKSEETWF